MSQGNDQKSTLSAQQYEENTVNWLAILNDLSRQVNLTPEAVEQTLGALLEQLIKTSGIDAAAIWTPEPDTDFLMVYTSHGLSDRFVRFFNKTDRIKVGYGLIGEVMKNRTTKSFSTFDEYKQVGIPRWFDVVQSEGINAILSVPLFVGEDLYGSFNIYYHQEHIFSQAEISFAETFANQMAVVFENRSQNETLLEDGRRYKKQRDELVSIQNVVRSVDTTLYTDISTSIKNLSTYIADTYQGHGVAILHELDEKGHMHLVEAHNLSPAHHDHLANLCKDGSCSRLVTAAYKTEKPIVVDRVFTSEYIEKTWATIMSNDRLVSLAAFSLTTQDHTAGLFIVYYDHLHKFNEDELSVLNTFGQFLAVSLENVKIFRSLNAEKRKTESMIDSLKDGLIVISQTGSVIELNPAAETLLGITHHEVEQLQKDKTTLQDYDELKQVVELVVAEYETVEIRLTEPEERMVQVTHVPLKDEAFTDIGAMRILHDVTDEYKTKELKSNFVATATHQMRTPLTGMRWGIDGLVSGDYGEFNAKQKSILAELAKTNNFVLSLVNDLLNVSRVENSVTAVAHTSINLCLLLQDLMKTEYFTINKKDLKINIHCDDAVATVSGNVTDLKLAFQNIIDNAIKYTPEKGVITITVTQSDTEVFVEVSDTGIGISPDDLKLLFNKFFRGKNAVRFETDGSGLGLYLTRQILQNHKGSVTAISELNQGTTFRVSLPKKVYRTGN